MENGLSIVENPKPNKGNYGTWLGDNKPIPHRDNVLLFVTGHFNAVTAIMVRSSEY